MVVTLVGKKKEAEGYEDIFHISATKIGKFRMCPMSHYLPYELDVWPVRESDPLRVGTNWHRLYELSDLQLGAWCPECKDKRESDPQCVICAGLGVVGETNDIILRELDRAYNPQTCPSWKTLEEWEIERVTLFYSFLAHRWYYSNSDYTVAATESSFKYRLPGTNISLDGRMDKLLRTSSQLLVGELKSTSSSVESDSDFWEDLRMALQPSIYLLAARELQRLKVLPHDLPIKGVLYDVWHKPTTKPKKLTQGDTLAFLQTGMYFEQKFEITTECAGARYLVDGVQVEVTPGKKEGTLAIKENPAMYGVRLLADMYERPQFYFAQREIPRTDPQLEADRAKIINIVKTIELMKEHNCWYTDETRCKATFTCPYTSICYNNVEIDSEHLPEGFEHRFTKEKK